MNQRKLVAFVLTSILFLPLLRWRGHDADEKYFLISANIKIPYWEMAGAGLSKAASDLKVRSKFDGPDGYDPKAEQEALQKAIQQKATGILISVVDPALMKDDIDRAIASGIPVITIDSDAPTSKRLFFIGTNNYDAGLAGGKRLVQELKGKGNVAVFTMPSQSNLKERLHGYKDAIEGTQVKLAQTIDIKGDPRIAFDTATQMLASDKKEHIDAFVCLEALSGKEIATVLQNNGIKGRTIIAMDTDPETLDWVQKGVIAATISQKPYTMAYVGLKMLDDLHHSQLGNLNSDWARDSFSPVPAFIDTGSALVDKSNVEAFIAATKSHTGH